MKILLVGDASGMHASLAHELRKQGHEVVLLSDGGGYQHTSADILLKRKSGFTGGIQYLYHVLEKLSELRGFDVVQLINPHFLKLRPGKLRYLFNELKRYNGKLYLTLCGDDYFFVRAATDGHTFRYSEYRVGTEKTPFARDQRNKEAEWLTDELRRYTEFVYDNVSGAMSALYEYHKAALPLLGDKLIYTGIPIDTERLLPAALPDGKIRITVGRRPERIVQKGADILLKGARDVEAELPHLCEVQELGGIDMDTYYSCLRQSHIVLDQLYAYSPATNALATMALGRVAGSGADEEYARFVGETDLPLIKVSPFSDWKTELRSLVLKPEELRQRAGRARAFVEKQNSSSVVASRFLDYWMKN